MLHVNYTLKNVRALEEDVVMFLWKDFGHLYLSIAPSFTHTHTHTHTHPRTHTHTHSGARTLKDKTRNNGRKVNIS